MWASGVGWSGWVSGVGGLVGWVSGVFIIEKRDSKIGFV